MYFYFYLHWADFCRYNTKVKNLLNFEMYFPIETRFVALKLRTKGQLISELLFGFFNFPKKKLQKFDEFLPKNLKSG